MLAPASSAGSHAGLSWHMNPALLDTGVVQSNITTQKHFCLYVFGLPCSGPCGAGWHAGLDPFNMTFQRVKWFSGSFSGFICPPVLVAGVHSSSFEQARGFFLDETALFKFKMVGLPVLRPEASQARRPSGKAKAGRGSKGRRAAPESRADMPLSQVPLADRTQLSELAGRSNLPGGVEKRR